MAVGSLVVVLHFHMVRDFEEGKGVIKSHTPLQPKSTRHEPFHVFQCYCIDNAAFIFEWQEQLERGLQIIHHHFTRFGLEMHIGKNEDGKITPSKTECIFFPQPQIFNKNSSAIQEEENIGEGNELTNEAMEKYQLEEDGTRRPTLQSASGDTANQGGRGLCDFHKALQIPWFVHLIQPERWLWCGNQNHRGHPINGGTQEIFW